MEHLARPRHPVRSADRCRVAIVGAGPAGLACALALGCHGLGDDLRVLDPSGRWLSAWRRRFSQQDIEALRSPAVHHPHPDPFALLAAGGHEGLVRSGGTHLPTRTRFEAFVTETVVEAGLDDRVEPHAITSVTLLPTGAIAVTRGDGSLLVADHLVLATNRRVSSVPGPVAHLLDDPRVIGSEQADVRLTPAGGRVAIVGGGLSAAHLALGAVARGAQVTLLARRRLTVRRFDVHPGWLGPRKLRGFTAEPDPKLRRRAIDHARGGGSIPHAIHARLEAAEAQGQLVLRERVRIRSASSRPSELHLELEDGEVVRADTLWLATGGQIDLTTDPLCAPLVRHTGTFIAGGLPELAADLSLPGSRVHLTGFATALQLGPTAGNLIGHRRAAARICAALRGLDPVRADDVRTGAGACPSRPERRQR